MGSDKRLLNLPVTSGQLPLQPLKYIDLQGKKDFMFKLSFFCIFHYMEGLLAISYLFGFLFVGSFIKVKKITLLREKIKYIKQWRYFFGAVYMERPTIPNTPVS